MPRQKHFFKTSKKQKPQVPSTADDFFVAGVDFEEAGEKWRAGDAAKSCRFFVRAIETYDGGLHRFPRSFDLAYNKARIQYDLCQQPKLLQQLPTPLVDLLQLSLESHRWALSLEPANADVLFNTAQVLTSLAELPSEGATTTRITTANIEEALQLLQEALEMFQRCLVLQESQFVQAEAEAEMIAMSLASDQDNVPLPSSSSSVSDISTQEQWASILEPVTKSTLVDTVTAMTETLTDACNLGLLQDLSLLSWMEAFYKDNVDKKLAMYAENSTKQPEAFLARFNFLCAYSDANFRIGRLDLPTYERELENTFVMNSDLFTSPQGLCDMADAMLAFNSSVRARINYVDLQSSDAARLSQVQWKHLSTALANLKSASTLPEVQNLPKIHNRRGDCELLRYRLGEAPVSYQPAQSNAVMLLANAATYYRGAAGVAKAEGVEREEFESRVKEAVVSSITRDDSKLSELLTGGRGRVISILEDARDEGLIPSQVLQRFGLV